MKNEIQIFVGVTNKVAFTYLQNPTQSTFASYCVTKLFLFFDYFTILTILKYSQTYVYKITQAKSREYAINYGSFSYNECQYSSHRYFQNDS